MPEADPGGRGDKGEERVREGEKRDMRMREIRMRTRMNLKGKENRRD